MSSISRLSDLVSNLKDSDLSAETINSTKMHVLDSIGAMLSGTHSKEGLAVRSLLSNISYSSGSAGNKTRLLSNIIANCSAARCTEFDDIHLESCTTPGSVVVPTAISLLDAGHISDSEDFITSIITGYEVLVRFGLAINGPAVLQRGIWPTYFSAALGAATVTSCCLKLNQIQTINALSTAFAFSSGTVIHPHGELTTRWLTVGIAAQNGVIAAFAVKNGFTGTETIAAETTGQFYGIPFNAGKLDDDLYKRFVIDETGLKPYPVARQGLAAVEAFRDIIAKNKVTPESIQNIIVSVPEQVIGVINRPTLTGNRLDAISSVQYQIALAAVKPDELLDFEREQVFSNESVRSLMQKIKIVGNSDYTKYYPLTWPAKVEVTIAGQNYNNEVLFPPGDHRNPLDWEMLYNKFSKATNKFLKKTEVRKLFDLIRNANPNSDFSILSSILTKYNRSQIK